MAALKDDPFRDVVNDSSDPLLLTLGSGGERLRWFLDGPIHALDLVGSNPCRRSTAYPRRRNYAGEYPFGGEHRMVMLESRTELVGLMEVDHGGAVDGIAAQPFGVVFCDRTRHYRAVITADPAADRGRPNETVGHPV
ncbi:hypothetical protein [Arthrobacter oryzae]|uniref:hypothetical protein n=1 Tax=Arthrobacter oryzae TaxID=409290 RepID=UPI0011CEAA2D|nr:hypothetical protein [Arthrobacter oryzae]